MQAKGSLEDTSLRSLLEGAQSERATGTLTVRRENQSCTLFFLFGHLFHATGEGGAGDEAVLSALAWHDGEFAFDPKAKLPADETVRMSIPELLGQAGENGARPAGEPAQAAPPPAPEARKEAAESRSAGRGVKHRPQPKHAQEPIPVPSGEVTYDSLKTSFVDFPRLVTTLENEGYTGYVRLLTEGSNGLILFREGVPQECVMQGGDSVVRGREALLNFNEEVTRGNGVLDVVGLSPEIVDGLYDLVVARPVYTELYASWVDMPALLEFLAEQKLTGSVMVRASGGTGVIILTAGKPTGAYTSESRTIEKDERVVLDLCADTRAMIEVKAADHGAGRPPLNVDEVVGSRTKSGGSTAPSSSAPPAAPQPAPAAAAPAPLPVAPTPEPEAPSLSESGAVAPEPASAATATTQLPAFNPAMSETTPIPSYQQPQPGTGTESAGPPAGAPAPSRPEPNWETVIEELQGMADRALGARSRKVKDLLASAERNRAGVEEAVAQVSQISLLFVDSALLVQLEEEMQARLQAL